MKFGTLAHTDTVKSLALKTKHFIVLWVESAADFETGVRREVTKGSGSLGIRVVSFWSRDHIREAWTHEGILTSDHHRMVMHTGFDLVVLMWDLFDLIWDLTPSSLVSY